MKDGSKWEGLFHSAAPLTDATPGPLALELGMAVQVSANNIAIDTLQVIPTPKMTFSDDDVVSITAKGISADPTGPRGVAGFQTDGEISSSLHGQERELKSWADVSEDDIARVGGLGDESTMAGWDQFEANKRWGVQTTYSEDLYTTSLDRGSDFYKKKEAEAARLAAEIEREVSSNPHVAEERGQKQESDGIDEEDKYSSVIRDGGAPNFAAVAAGKTGTKYVVPARRADSPSSGKDSAQADDGASSPVAPGSPTLPGRRGSRGKDLPIVLARQHEFANGSPVASPKTKPQSPTITSKLASLQLDSSSPRVGGKHAEELALLATQPSVGREEQTNSLKSFSASLGPKLDAKKKDDDAGKMNPNAKEFKPGMSILSLLEGGKKTAAVGAAPVASTPMVYGSTPFISGQPVAAAYPPAALTPAPSNSFFDRPVYADVSPIASTLANAVRGRLKSPRTPASSRSPSLAGSESWVDPGLPPPRRASFADPAPALPPVEMVAPQQPAYAGYYPAYDAGFYAMQQAYPYGYGYVGPQQFYGGPYHASPPPGRPQGPAPANSYAQLPAHQGKRGPAYPGGGGYQAPMGAYQQYYPNQQSPGK